MSLRVESFSLEGDAFGMYVETVRSGSSGTGWFVGIPLQIVTTQTRTLIGFPPLSNQTFVRRNGPKSAERGIKKRKVKNNKNPLFITFVTS